MKYRKFKKPSKKYLSADRLKILETIKNRDYVVSALDDIYKVVQVTKDGKNQIINLSPNINNTNSLTFFKDKICTYRILETLKVNYPNGTYYYNNYESELLNTIEQDLKKKYSKKSFVIKPNDSSKSNGVFIFDNFNENVRNAIIESFSFSDTILVQDFIYGSEFRFICIKNKIAFGIQKFEYPKESILCDNEFLVNYNWIAELIHFSTGADLFGIDIKVNKTDYFVLEINSRPGLSASFNTYTAKQKEIFYSFIVDKKINF